VSAEIRRLLEQWRKDAARFAGDPNVPAVATMLTSMHADELDAALLAVPTVIGWRLIETAPKDGTVLCCFKGGWRSLVDVRVLPLMRPQPTHWMPLPPPPADTAALLAAPAVQHVAPEPHAVKPPSLPRYPRSAVCPTCGKGGGDDTTVISYVAASDGARYISCGYCGAENPT